MRKIEDPVMMFALEALAEHIGEALVRFVGAHHDLPQIRYGKDLDGEPTIRVALMDGDRELSANWTLTGRAYGEET